MVDAVLTALRVTLPEVRASMRDVSRRGAVARLLRHVSVTRSLWYSARLRGLILIARDVIVDVGRGARIQSTSGSLLLVGFEHVTATPPVLHIGDGSRLELDGLVQVMRGAKVFVGPGGRLTIGNRSFVNDHAWITCFERVEIGSGVAISWHAHIMDSDVHQLVAEGRRSPNTRPVAIGDRVWVGAGATVLKGVAVQAGSVVAAGAVVNRDVPSDTLVAGNPARPVRSGVSWEL